MSSPTIVDSEHALRSIIKPYPKVMDKRIQTSLDDHCLEFIQHARFIALGFNHDSLGIQVASLKSAHLRIISPTQLKVRLANRVIEESLANQNITLAYSAYLMIPGVGHGLRVNGLAQIQSEDTCDTTLDISAAYFQCARASVRANLWGEPPHPSSWKQPILAEETSNTLTQAGIHFLSQSSFLLMLTQDKQCQTEISPRGDDGRVAIALDKNTLLIAERPGNKVAISLRNIIEQPRITLSFIIPGCYNVLHIIGEARLTKDAALLKPLAIKGKAPKLGILVTVTEQKIITTPGLRAENLWDKHHHHDAKRLTSFPQIMAEHMNGRGLLGKVSTPIVKTIVHHDLKNLY